MHALATVMSRHIVASLIITMFAFMLTQRAAQAVHAPKTPSLSNYVLSVYRETDGLPQAAVKSIVQTRDCYIWIATQEALVRFNDRIHRRH